MLRVWLKNLEGCANEEVQHIVLVVGDQIPPGSYPANVRFVGCEAPNNKVCSIGHYHNLGSRLANSEWIMKLDIDCLPHTEYFTALLPILRRAEEREWFNGGMFYINKEVSVTLFAHENMPLTLATYNDVIQNIRECSANSYHYPAASNFICRREDYVKLGGCDVRFQGYGWEDYQQLYMLEYYYRQQDPLPGDINLQNVPVRCRDEISRRKAKELYARDSRLCLLHHWHASSTSPGYRSHMDANRHVLLDYILKSRNPKL